MNVETEIDRLLQSSGAQLIRDNNHLVYRLPNGSNFIRPKTTSDFRSAQNGLHALRRILGMNGGRKEEALPKMTTTKPEAPAPLEPAAPRELAFKPAPAALKERIEAAAVTLEVQAEDLMSKAQAAERQAKMLRGLLEFSEDPATEDILRGLVPAPPPPPPVREAEAAVIEVPDQITERVQVTRQIVFAATQTFEEDFTINDIYERMVGTKRVDQPERLRIRSSIATAMKVLDERGEVLKVQQGVGRQQTVWHKATLSARTT